MNWSWLLPSGKGIPVLMYHKVWPGVNDGLTITPEKLREQWTILKQEGYTAISLPEYLEIVTGKKPHSAKVVLLTFDDGYRNNFTYAYPLLKEFGWKATFFIIGNTLAGAGNQKESGPEQKMTLQELKTLDPAIVQLAVHGYEHENMSQISSAQSQSALQSAIEVFDDSGLTWHKVLAYPYGARPAAEMKLIMAGMGIKAAFRIGNKVSEVPALDMFEIKRIDIKGTDTPADFRIKLRKGKLKPF